ncbi:hypothetical protein B0A54_07425 [Friedmanniomyces endolithicus]|uniref:Homologous-pairing protein 2 winged helix domain-containing protein n=1 Tax=Friedmanniomyces endolithicus TaxID=329885 RepID=A0A4U0V2K0_9PEZI|nr:hypothetical protein B0A54_07425 [Friedmanniomyces endolithicus]
MAPIKKDAEDTKKEAKLNPEQSATLILDYLRKQNRPYSATDISANLKNRVTKTAAAKLLKACTSARRSRVARPASRLCTTLFNLESLQQIDAKTTRLRDETTALKAEEKELQKALRGGGASQISLSDLKASIAALERDKAEMAARLSALTSGDLKPVSVEEREKICAEHRMWQRAAAARKRIRGELWGVIKGVVEKEKWEETREELGLEF